MNPNISDIFDEIDDRYIAEAANAKRRSRRPYWIGAVAAALALIIGLSALFGGGALPNTTTGPQQLESVPTFPTNPPLPTVPAGVQLISLPSPGTLQLANLVGAPEYPKVAAKDAYHAWVSFRQEWRANYSVSSEELQSLENFFLRSTQLFLSGEGNQVYSPMNLYMALAMLAECTDGNSRQEILDLLGADSIEAVRTQTQKIWLSTYYTDEKNKSLLAGSVWLDDSYSINSDTVQTLTDKYYASTFHGDLGTEAMNEQLRTWLDSQTNGFLKEQHQNLKLKPDTVFALASTLYYTAEWEEPFNEKRNTIAMFYSPDAPYPTKYMNGFVSNYYSNDEYYEGDHFTAVTLNCSGGSMWLILPNEGYTPQDLLVSGKWLNKSAWNAPKNVYVRVSIPKFDISSQKDLAEGMKLLGLQDVFDSNVSDFSPICSDSPIFVSKIDHNVRVAIDEDGVTAASSTIIHGMEGGGTPNEYITFTLDRPFLFVLASGDNLPLFVGIVNEP